MQASIDELHDLGYLAWTASCILFLALYIIADRVVLTPFSNRFIEKYKGTRVLIMLVTVFLLCLIVLGTLLLYVIIITKATYNSVTTP